MLRRQRLSSRCEQSYKRRLCVAIAETTLLNCVLKHEVARCSRADSALRGSIRRAALKGDRWIARRGLLVLTVAALVEQRGAERASMLVTFLLCRRSYCPPYAATVRLLLLAVRFIR